MRDNYKGKTHIQKINGVNYQLSKEEIKVGDLFYFRYRGYVEEYEDIDYNYFQNPNNIPQAWKAVPVSDRFVEYYKK